MFAGIDGITMSLRSATSKNHLPSDLPKANRRRQRKRANQPRSASGKQGHSPLLMRGIVIGAAAGLLATAPMTLVMSRLHRNLPRRQRYPLPPSRITANLENAANMEHRLTHEEHKALTLLAHYGYGSAMGVLYGAASSGLFRANMFSGALFGLGVWAGSYLGLLPVTGLHESATEEPADRNALMIAAHLVWGAVTGEITRQGLKDRSS